MGQYLQGTQKSVRAWTIHGLAVKTALQLGLQSSEASKGFLPLEREIRKRTWYTCVILDRLVVTSDHAQLLKHVLSRHLSMTFGRPAAIADNYVKLELPLDYDAVLLSTTPSDPCKQVSVRFFNVTM